MPRTKQRLTKTAVLEEVNELRDKLRMYNRMSLDELTAEYQSRSSQSPPPDAKEMVFGLTMAATYYLTHVLDLE